MKKQEGHVSRIVYCLLAGILIAGILHPPQTLSQTGTPDLPAQKTDVWNAAYKVTIKGSGVDEGEPGSGDQPVSWSILRIYNGNIVLAGGLDTADPNWTEKERVDALLRERKLFFFDKSPLIHVVINDYVHRKGDDSCAQYSTSQETWNADVMAIGDLATMKIDNKYYTHDTSFPTMYLPKGTAFDVMYQRDVFSWPAATVERGKPERLSILTYRIPDIKEWLESNGEVTRNNVNFVKNENGLYVFESPELPINESLLKGVNTSGKVTVQITYALVKQVK